MHRQKNLFRREWIGARIRAGPLVVGLLAASLVWTGCSSSDERVVQVATQAAERQAKQNEQMARLQEEVAAGTRQLVGADAGARKEWVELARETQRTMGRLAQQHDELESERRSLAAARQRDPVIAIAIEQFGWIVVILAPIVVAAYLYISIRQRKEILHAEVLQQIISQHPALLLEQTTKTNNEGRDGESHRSDQDRSP